MFKPIFTINFNNQTVGFLHNPKLELKSKSKNMKHSPMYVDHNVIESTILKTNQITNLLRS